MSPTGNDGRNSESSSSRALRVVSEADSEQLVSDAESDYNLRILQPMFGYVSSKFGEETLHDVIYTCGLPPSALTRKAGWVSHEHFERLLAAIRDLIGSDTEFMRACVYEFKKQYGAFLLVMRCMSVRTTYELMAKTGHMVCKVGGFSTSAATRESIRIKYTTTCPESRLNCLSRQAQLSSLPTVFLGMAPAKLHERSCVAHGDDCCEYELSWYEPIRIRWLALGAALGAAVAATLPPAWAAPAFAFTILPLLGAAVGFGLELRRLLAEHLSFTNQTALEMEKVIASHAQVMDELSALQVRERSWNRHLEEAVDARTKKLNAVVGRLQAALRRRTGDHPQVAGHAAGGKDALDRAQAPTEAPPLDSAVERVSRLVGELVSIARHDPGQQDAMNEEVSVDELVAQIRGQLKATSVSRNIRITVFQTREAPASLVTKRPILARIVDNLLFNATRHTDRGSIVVEVGGTPGSLLIKLSDTGLGISKERLEQIFASDASNLPAEHRSDLSHATRLLDQIGGRLEIMSEPDVGTTLWVYIPVKPPEPTSTDDVGDEQDAEDSMMGRIVTIRPHIEGGS